MPSTGSTPAGVPVQQSVLDASTRTNGYALAQYDARPTSFDLNEWMGCAPRMRAPAYRPPSFGAGTSKTRNNDPDLARLGNRNETLFEILRLHPDVMFKAHRFAAWETWHTHVHKVGDGVIESFPSCCPYETTVKRESTVLSVASWYWDKRGAGRTLPRRRYDHSPEYQAARGRRSGQVRREANWARDAEICRIRADGATLEEIGLKYKLHRTSVWHIVNRE